MNPHVLSAVNRLLRAFYAREERTAEQRGFDDMLRLELQLMPPFPPRK